MPNGKILNTRVIGNAKKHNRIFTPKDKRPDYDRKFFTFQLRIILEGRNVVRKISCEVLRNPPDNRPYLVVKAKTGDTLALDIDIEELAKSLNNEINPKLDLRRELRCYIIEIVQASMLENIQYTP